MISLKYQRSFQQIFMNFKICNNKYVNITYPITAENTAPCPGDVKMHKLHSLLSGILKIKTNWGINKVDKILNL